VQDVTRIECARASSTLVDDTIGCAAHSFTLTPP
jgi:hypothetical protein